MLTNSVRRLDRTSSRFDVLGVNVSAVNMKSAVATIRRWLSERTTQYVCVTGVHGVMESQRNCEIRTIHNRAGLVTPDGMPLVALGRLFGHADVSRVYGPELMLEVLEVCCREGYSSFLYGATPETLERLTGSLSSRFPGLKVAGSYSPPFRALTPDEIGQVADRINRSGADVVWVGLSTPKQEQWMAKFRPLLKAPVLLGVGAAFDFHAGNVRQAPRWMQRVALEWLFRLLMEPRRLWRRYLYNNPRFLLLISLQLLGLRKADVEIGGEESVV